MSCDPKDNSTKPFPGKNDSFLIKAILFYHKTDKKTLKNRN